MPAEVTPVVTISDGKMMAAARPYSVATAPSGDLTVSTAATPGIAMRGNGNGDVSRTAIRAATVSAGGFSGVSGSECRGRHEGRRGRD